MTPVVTAINLTFARLAHSPSDIEKIIHDAGASRVLMAMPNASRRKRRAALEQLSKFPVHVQTIPEIADLVSGKARVDDIRDVDVKDLLGRDAVPPNPKLLGASIADKNVMVTGAGGESRTSYRWSGTASFAWANHPWASLATDRRTR